MDVQCLGGDEDDNSNDHTDERHEEAPGKADLLLDVGYSGVSDQ